VVDPLVFIGAGELDNTFVTTLKTLTGFSAGNVCTWLEVVCTTKDVPTTDAF
jgi:hypothetical protein